MLISAATAAMRNTRNHNARAEASLMVASNADFDGQESVAADSIAADSVITVRTKNTCQGETASRPLFELVERQEWRLCMLKMQTEPHQARFHGTISIAGQMTHAYPLHLAVSKKPPVCSFMYKLP